MAEPAATTPTNPSTNHEQQTTEINQESPQSSDSPISDQLSRSPSPNQSPEPPSPSPVTVPDCIDSITELRSFSGALSAFYRCFDDLKVHLDSVKAAIDSELDRQNLPVAPIPNPLAEENPILGTSESVPISSPKPNDETDKEKVKENGSERASSELESLCARMSPRCLKRYILSNLTEPEKLREEVPKALKLAPNPAKLVLEGIGRFFLQGSKAYTFDSPMVTGREASVLMLECLLLMEKENNAVDIEKVIKEEAEQSAKSWKKRMLSEGGLASASEIDARGLLMFLGCYGVPSAFKYEDIKDLVTASNVKGIVGVLKRSSVLMRKITDSIDWMVKNKMVIEGVDMAYSFEVQENIKSRSILASFLREAKESWKSVKKSARESSAAMYDANKKHLAALKSVVKCAQRHNIDVANLIPGWQVNEKITNLEEKIAEYESERALQKRKADEIDSSRKVKNVEMKRMRHTIHGLPQQRVPVPVDGQRNYLDRGHLSSSYASPSLLHGAGTGLLPESHSGSVVVGSGLTGAPYAHGESIVDSSGRAIVYSDQHYVHGRHGDVVTYEDRLGGGGGHYGGQQRSTHDLVAHYAGQASSADLVAHYAGQNSSSTALYRTSASVEDYAGLPSSSPARIALAATRTTPTSELYHFADAVTESDAYPSRGTRPVGTVPSSHHHSSYLY